MKAVINRSLIWMSASQLSRCTQLKNANKAHCVSVTSLGRLSLHIFKEQESYAYNYYALLKKENVQELIFNVKLLASFCILFVGSSPLHAQMVVYFDVLFPLFYSEGNHPSQGARVITLFFNFHATSDIFFCAAT
jgi:hypothetical protein